jgi:alpha-L-rhamnosidase
MVWDGEGRPSGWSDSASWSMGLLSPADWQGDWIGYDAHRHINSDPPAAPLHGARWICHPEDKDGQEQGGRTIYVGVCDLPETAVPNQATLTVCCDDSATVLLNDREVARATGLYQPVSEQVASYLRPGRNVVRVLGRNGGGGSTGLCLKLEITARDGEQYILTTDDQWYCMRDDQDSWESRSLEGAAHVHVLGPFGMEPWGLIPIRRDLSAPPSYMRGTFAVERPVRRATVYLASLGLVDLTLNGQLVNKDYFSSGWTDYKKRVYYRAYDVTDIVSQGENVCGAVLADGWYSGHIAWGARRDVYGTKPRFRTMLRVEYEDGSNQVFATDKSWTATTGPKKLADFLVGEEYDATAEVTGWDKLGNPPAVVGPVDVGAEISPEIQWHPGPPVVEVGEFPAKSVNEPIPGIYVYDVGQNLAGVVRIKVRGRKGQRVMIRHAERLNPDGTLYTTNLRLARAVDFYTCKGTGEEVWQPRQTFHGFQYVELSGLDEQPPLDAVTAIALSSDTPLASEFDCSDPQLNRLYQNVLWTQRANFIDIPTDCPQRDERLGWTGDAQVYAYTACRVTDVQAFFRKWLNDLGDAQREDGQFPRVAPVIPGEEDGGPAWADAGVICPWEIYQSYGDIKLLERQYPSMVRFVEFCRQRSRGEVLPPREFHTFGDWLSVNAETPHDVIYMAYYARSVDLLQQAAVALGKHDDAQRYSELLSRIKQAFVEEFVDEEGHVRGQTQCAYVLAIAYGLVESELRDRAAEYLVEDIESRGWKLSTGFVGTKDLMLALSDVGRSDVALKLLHQSEYPGWLFSISHGATSIWERWDGWTPDRGFQDPGMNSFAHYSFGAVYGWMVECLGGIHSAEPGFGQLVIQPTFDPALDHCRVLYDSIRGPIETEWTVSSDKRAYSVKIPANVAATLRLEGRRTEELLINEQSIAEAGLEGTDELAGDGSSVAVISLPSGSYVFTMPR